MIEKPALRRLFLPGDRLRSPPLADLRWLAKISYLPSPRSLFHRGQRVQFDRFRIPLNHCQCAMAGHGLNFKRGRTATARFGGGGMPQVVNGQHFAACVGPGQFRGLAGDPVCGTQHTDEIKSKYTSEGGK